MEDIKTLLCDTAGHILSDFCTVETINACEAGTWPEALWQALEESGLTRALLPANHDGSDLGLREAVAVLELAGYYAAPIPLAETWLAGLALSGAGRDVPTGPLTVAPISIERDDAGDRIHLVPWGRRLPVLQLRTCEAGPQLQLIQDARVERQKSNIAGEPSDCLDVCNGRLAVETAAPWPIQRWFALGALFRTAQMAGALRRCMDLSAEYVTERKQFGRPLTKFQAIQQQLALLAGEVAATTTAVDAAAVAASQGNGLLDIAVAKARAGIAVESGTRISHQVHGAIGFSYEHRLHHFTRRLWAWRDEFGTEHYWNDLLGQYALEAGGTGLWPDLITRLGSPGITETQDAEAWARH